MLNVKKGNSVIVVISIVVGIMIGLFFGSWIYKKSDTQVVVGDTPTTTSVTSDKSTQSTQQIQKRERRALSGWDKRTSEFEKLRMLRYGTAVKLKPIPIGEWYPKRGVIELDKLESTIREVMRRLPHIRTSNNLVDLILETSMVESHAGKNIIGYKNRDGKLIPSGDCGVFQIRVTTAANTLEWLKTTHEDVYIAINNFYNQQQDLAWNITHNVPFATALCVTYYWRRDPHRLVHGIGTLAERGAFWLDEYNSTMGAGDMNAFVSRVKYIRSKQKV